VLALGPVGEPVAVVERASSLEADAIPTAPSANASLEPTSTPVAAPVVAPTLAPEAATPSPAVLLDEDFSNNRMGWPDRNGSAAWLAGGAYRLAAWEPGRFVAVGAPLRTLPNDVVVTARFRKVGGPSGGGYGVIVRDQEPASRDGVRQSGRYYVLEISDRGEIGVWRREEDHWVDLLPWTPSDSVNRGGTSNEVEVLTSGSRLTLLVNGVQVTSQVDDALPGGGVGVFVGGDGNEVALERFVVQAPAVPHSEPQAPEQTTAIAAPAPTPTANPFSAITRVVIPTISLDTEVVPARLVQQDGSVTWAVPPFKVGHAQGTAGAGSTGNAVLVGHVSSQRLGNVFENLQAVQPGDTVEVFGDGREFSYSIVDVRRVSRDDVTVVQPTDAASITLLTCTGVWLPVLSDYAERLVVRARLDAPNVAQR